MEILNSNICLFEFCSSSRMTALQMLFALCSLSKIFDDGFEFFLVLRKMLKKYGK